MRRANHLRVLIASDDMWDRPDTFGTRMPLSIRFVTVVNLHKLRDVDVGTERTLDRARPSCTLMNHYRNLMRDAQTVIACGPSQIQT